MKPAWDKLMKKFADNKGVLIADVDCTAAGKELCSAQDVKGYPTIKHGDPAGMEDYKGGRDYDALEKFAGTLKPLCSPFNIDLCEDDEKTKIEELLKTDLAELKENIAAEEKKVSDAEAAFKSAVDKLQKKYESLTKEKDDTVAKVKADGLGLMKSVLAKKEKDADKDEEL